jgi:serine/threonine-protein kinase
VKRWLRRGLIAVLGTATAGVTFWFALVHTVHRGTLAVPNLREQTIEHARQQLHDLGLELVVEEPGVFSSEVEPGAIAHQEPPSGFHVKAGSRVVVRTSLGGETVLVPDIRGASLKTAEREIETSGLEPGRRARVEGQGGADRVIATGPPVGVEIAPRMAVDLLVNTAPEENHWVMPSLLSLPIARVERLCADNRLRLGRAREVEYPGVSPGTVLRQYPPAGSPVAPSDIITVWVSR